MPRRTSYSDIFLLETVSSEQFLRLLDPFGCQCGGLVPMVPRDRLPCLESVQRVEVEPDNGDWMAIIRKNGMLEPGDREGESPQHTSIENWTDLAEWVRHPMEMMSAFPT